MARLLTERTASLLSAFLGTTSLTSTHATTRHAASRHVLPWSVRWSDAAADWLVYIPAGSVIGRDLVLTDLSAPAADMDGQPPPPDWYLSGLPPEATDLVANLAEDGTVALTPEAAPGALFSMTVARLTAVPADPATGTPASHTVAQLVLGAVSLGGGGGPSETFVPGWPEIIQDGGSWWEVYYFGRVTVANGVPAMTKLEPAVIAYRVPVVTHGADHTNGVVDGLL